MTAQHPNPASLRWLQRYFPADAVALASLWLLHTDCSETGGVYSVGGGRMAKLGVYTSPGPAVPLQTPEDVRDRFNDISADAPIKTVHSLDEEMRLYDTFLGADRKDTDDRDS
jgi:hypothetical protein